MTNLTGTPGNDTLTGTSLDDTLNGLAGADKMSGGDGNDTLDGGTGDDAMMGGKGNDFYYVDSAKDVVTERAGGGRDYVYASISYVLGANVEHLFLEGGDLNGTGNVLDNELNGSSGNNKLDGSRGDDVLNAGDGSDHLEGGTGNDYLNGEAGNDLMKGGIGDDSYVVESAGDVVIEASGQGNDTIRTYFDTDLSADIAHIENLTLLGSADLTGKGNGVSNALTGNSGKNLLDGAAGNDMIDGGAGADTINGGIGNDRLFGREGDDQLSGGDGDDYLDGGFGTNTLTGGKGNDAYDIANGVAADTIVELAGEGIDTVINNKSTVLSNAGFNNIENLVLSGDTALYGFGNILNNAITGNGTNNDLYGGDGDDTLSGGDGDDSLSGGFGKDAMTGGRGDDAYLVIDGGDKVTERAGEGFDTVRTYLTTYVLGDNIESLEFIAPVAAVGTGNSLANNVSGEVGNDTLDGKSGDDYLYGKEGDDTLIGGAGNDVFRYTLDNMGGLSGLGGDDTITGFEVGKDKIDILDLIDDFDVGSDPFGAGYLKLSIDNGNTLLQFDTDGGGDSFVTLATVQGVTNLTLSDLIYHLEGNA